MRGKLVVEVSVLLRDGFVVAVIEFLLVIFDMVALSWIYSSNLPMASRSLWLKSRPAGGVRSS
jgi:hypothetical protein